MCRITARSTLLRGTTVVNDFCLTSFLAATSDDVAWRGLDVLLKGEIGVRLGDTITRHLTRSRWMTDHIEDVLAELRVKLTEKLWSLRAGLGEPIENFHAYCATAAERACYAFLRRRFPERTRLRNRIRYAVTHHPATALQEDSPGLWRCKSTILRVAVHRGNAQALLDSPQMYAAEQGIDTSTPLPQLVAALLATCEEPVEFDRLVDAIAELIGVSDAPPLTSPAAASAPSSLDRVADPAAPITAVLEQRESLAEVWQELVSLPVRQRTALLLNLRDPDGGATLQLLPATGLVTMSDIASALAIDDAELARIWTDLPLDDLTIATRLGATRQQVINLRKSARARLARRLGRN